MAAAAVQGALDQAAIDQGGIADKAPVVLVVGANGFLGGYIVSTLRQQGFAVLRGVREPRAGDERQCDLARMDAETVSAALAGVDVVVNAAGILTETGRQTFAQIHVEGPLTLAKACMANGVRRFVQVSALGVAEDGGFIASKHRFDGLLQALPLASVILRPSIVYAVSGSYGGTSLLRALAGMPGRQWLPGDGRWLLQPVVVDDLAQLVARAARGNGNGIYEVGGPTPLSLREYQARWRRWLRIPGTAAVHVPETLVSMQVWLWERIGRGPVGATMWRMLRRGNVTAQDAWQRLVDAFDVAPRALDDVLATRPSQVQDRWQAGLYFLAPALRLGLVLLWVLSAVAGLITPADDILRLSGDSTLQALSPVALARAGGVLDAVLALWLATGWRSRWALAWMGISVIGYTAVLGTLLPSLWLAPLGGLAKNLVILPALAVLWVLTDRR